MESSPEKSFLMKMESENTTEVTEAEKEAALKSMRETNSLVEEDGSNFREELFAKLLGFGDESNGGKVTFTPREVAKIKRLAHAYMTDVTEPDIKKKVAGKVEKVEEDLPPFDPTERAVPSLAVEDPSGTEHNLVMEDFDIGTVHDEKTQPKIELKIARPKRKTDDRDRQADMPALPIDKPRVRTKKAGLMPKPASSGAVQGLEHNIFADIDFNGLSDQQKIETLRYFIKTEGDPTGAYQRKVDEIITGTGRPLSRAA